MATFTHADAPAAAMTPRPFRVAGRRREAPGIWTLDIEPAQGAPIHPAPGQFVMMYAFGIGEVALSVSGLANGRMQHTIAALGATTTAICASRRDAVLGVRGPYGNGWPLEAARGRDVVVAAGGVGLAPLRPAIRHLIAHRDEYGEVTVLYGSRTPANVLYLPELERWRRRGLTVDLTVDAAAPGWDGRVGFVSALVGGARFDPAAAVALVCGPEIMMRLTAVALAERGVAADRIHVSLERSMRCGIAHCGHCQLGPTLICRDGPVYPWDRIGPVLEVREL
jgi:anaerobic sulfite reductase subunit B